MKKIPTQDCTKCVHSSPEMLIINDLPIWKRRCGKHGFRTGDTVSNCSAFKREVAA